MQARRPRLAASHNLQLPGPRPVAADSGGFQSQKYQIYRMAVAVFLLNDEEGGGVRQQGEEVCVFAEAKSAEVAAGVGRLVEFH